jgi:hypothetical protein
MIVQNGPQDSVTNAGLYTVSGTTATPVGAANPVPVIPSSPTAANILNGFVNLVASNGGTTLLTVPAGRTWQGQLGMVCAIANAAAASTAGRARGVISTAGTGVIPTAGTVLAVDAKAGANAATGTVGSQGQSSTVINATIVAPVGNAVTLVLVTTVAGTVGSIDAFAIGALT